MQFSDKLLYSQRLSFSPMFIKRNKFTATKFKHTYVRDDVGPVNPNWVTGYTDGEGMFGINATPYGTNKDKYKLGLEFKVSQKDYSLQSLEDLQEYFGCGSITKDKDDVLKFRIQSKEDILDKVLPHFDRYPLQTSKAMDYNDFKKAALIYKEGEHLTAKGMEVILSLKRGNNSSRTEISRWLYMQSQEINLHPYWVAGFIDGEGTFQFRLRDDFNKRRGKTYVTASPTFELGQRPYSVGILRALNKFFGTGFLKPKYDIESWERVKKQRVLKNTSRYVNNDEEAIIKLLDNYPLRTRKYLDYKDWKLLIEMKNKGMHQTNEGFKTMDKVLRSMNKGRPKHRK